jgi:hypothetical protein
MTIRPFQVYGLLLAALCIATWRLVDMPRGEFTLSRDRLARWSSLSRSTAEELEHGLAHRYLAIAAELKGTRDVGYFSDKSWPETWAASATSTGQSGIERYYMAQAIVAPALLRFDQLRAKVVIDCTTPEQATSVLNREGLAVVRDFGQGLVLARPES